MAMNHKSQEHTKRLQSAPQNKPAAITKESTKTQLTSKVSIKGLEWVKTKAHEEKSVSISDTSTLIYCLQTMILTPVLFRS